MNDRFWSKVRKSATCWEWTAGTNAGYGVFSLAGRQVSAHRLAYELVVGPITEGLQLDHLCRNRTCVNPAHLEPVSALTNIRRIVRIPKSHCINGHRMDDANTWQDSEGHRHCKACNAVQAARWRRTHGIPGVCAVCGTEFLGRAEQTCCSLSCASRKRRLLA